MTPPSDCTGNDVPIWGLEANGQYSVHSGYLLACDLENEADQLWRDIWNWEGPVIQVGWCAAEQPFFTLNSDGSVRGRHGIATAGGCIRDNTGRILDAFTCNLRRCSITRAELTGAVVGLERAWELGAQAVEIQMDSSCAISILNGQLNLEHQHAGLVLRLRRLLERRWRVRIIHIFREGNHLADHIANRGHDLNFGIHTMRLDDATIQQWARYDLMGCSETRRVRSA
ncbi:Putative ribonuclease H protein At1g65750 [Linum perenne]